MMETSNSLEVQLKIVEKQCMEKTDQECPTAIDIMTNMYFFFLTRHENFLVSGVNLLHSVLISCRYTSLQITMKYLLAIQEQSQYSLRSLDATSTSTLCIISLIY